MSEELIPTRKAPRKPLGRGLGSLLGETKEQSVNSPPQVARPVTPVPAAVAAPSTPPRTVVQPPVAAKPAVGPAPAPVATNENRVWNIPIEKIIPNRNQPRKIFAAEQLKELADSIREKGIIQPILVRTTEKPNQYEIIAGERRWRAAQQAGLKEVPVIIKMTSPQETLELALIENIQRADLNPMEEAEAYAYLAKNYNMTQQEMAQKVGKDRATVANVMRLLQLHPEIREMVKKNEIQLGQAKVLLGVQEQDLQLQLARKAVRHGLTVRALERLVVRSKEAGDDISGIEEDNPLTRKMIKELELELQRKLGTRVKIEETQGKGRLTVYFYSTEELNQVVDRIRQS